MWLLCRDWRLSLNLIITSKLNCALERRRRDTEHFWTLCFLQGPVKPRTSTLSEQEPTKLSFRLTAMAAVQCCSMWIMLSSQDIMGFTSLHLAAKLGHYDIVHHLLSKASKYINCQVKTHGLIYWLSLYVVWVRSCGCESSHSSFSACVCAGWRWVDSHHLGHWVQAQGAGPPAAVQRGWS